MATSSFVQGRKGHVRARTLFSALVAASLVIGFGAAPAAAVTMQPPVFDLAWGSRGSDVGQFRDGKAVALDADGNVYVVEFGNHRVQKFTAYGGFLDTWGIRGAGPGEFYLPEDIAIDGSGNLYVADTFNHRVQKFDLDGNFVLEWGSLGTGDGQFAFVPGIAVDNSGNVYASDVETDRVQKFSPTGVWQATWGGVPNGSGPREFFNPEKLAVDSAGNIYVADQWNHRIQKITPDGAFAVFAGTTGTPGSANGEFRFPLGVAVDSDDNVYVADTDNNRIQVFDPDGNFLTKWGSPGTAPGQFVNPIGMVIDVDGTVYVADWENSRIQRFVVRTPAPLGTNKTVTTGQDTPYTFATADFGFRDNPGDSTPDNLDSVKVTTLPGNGGLTNNGNPVAAGDFVSAADIAAGNFVFTPAAGASGEPYTTFTFQVKDDGVVDNIDTSPNATTINVFAGNGPPAGTDKTVTTAQDTPYTFATVDFGFSDPNDSPPDSLLAIKISTLPGAGTLTRDGTALAAGDFVPAADVAAGKLVFTPAAGASGSPYASFTFQVQDNGGTAGGGVDLDPTPNAITINVPPAPPTGDTTPPTTSNVRSVLPEGGQVNSAPVLVTWLATDNVSGATDLVSQIQRRQLKSNGWGPWRDRATVTGAQSMHDAVLWRKYQYRVRTHDKAGNWGAWAESNPVKFLRREEYAFTRSAGWTRVHDANAMGAYLAQSSTVNATAKLRFQGNGVALVMAAGAGLGTIEVCLDPGTPGEACRVVNLATFSPSGPRRLVVAFTDLGLYNHRLRVRVLSGTVSLDGALISRPAVSPT